ncbi:MAG: hypothetical protein V1735_04805 [Nanoarchaeota archaeon]
MEGKQYLAFKIFIWLLAGFLVAIIGTWSYSTFLSAKHNVDSAKMPAMDCVAFVYRIADNFTYADGKLSFDLINEDYSEDITSITVESSLEKKEINRTVPLGFRRSFQVGIQAEQNVSIYPTGCSVYKKEVQLS